jgi:chromate transporter
LAIQFFNTPFVAILAVAAFAGWMSKRSHSPASIEKTSALAWCRTLVTAGICLVLWWMPIVGVAAWLGWESTPARMGLFFSQAAVVTFGGAYAVLPYVAQQAVETQGWLTGGQMMSGLALAETTPGPLIMVLQFVGFLGAWQQPGGLTPLVAATLGAAITTWVTFVPCFLWIFLGAPHIEQLRKNVRLTCALSAVTAAVVGVVLNLAVWFGWHVVRPTGDAANAAGVVGGTDWFVVAVGVGAFVAMQRWKMGVIPVVLASGVLGLAWAWVG